MAERDPEQRDTHDDADDTAEVPEIFERYRARHQAWLEQADALAQMRDEVRTAAEREAMEVVANARRNIRQIIGEARRDLLVLTAQLHAALGAASPPAPPKPRPALAERAATSDASRTARHEMTTEAAAAPPPEFTAAFERARAGIDALAEEAADLNLTAGAAARIDTPRPVEPLARRAPSAMFPSETFAQESGRPERDRTSAPGSPVAAPGIGARTTAHISVTESSAVRGVPWRPDADLVPSFTEEPERRTTFWTSRRVFAAEAAAALVITLVAGIVWLWRDAPPAGETVAVLGTETPDPPGTVRVRPEETIGESAGTTAREEFPLVEAPDAGAAVPSAPPAENAVAPIPADPTAVSIALTVQRPAWIRATIDGRMENGRTYAAGETRRIDASAAVSIRYGDAGAVLVSVNGSTPRSAGADGAVVTRHYGEAPEEPPAAVSATPAPSPGQAATRPPSPEPQASTDPAPALSEPQAPPAAEAEPWVPETNIVSAGRAWIDAYLRRDTTALAALGAGDPTVMDERRVDERFPAEAEGVQRQLEAVGLEFSGDTAIFTARMIEQQRDFLNTRTQEHISRVAQIWMRRDGRWQLADVRITSEARLGRLLR